jgi:hypothetical protein
MPARRAEAPSPGYGLRAGRPAERGCSSRRTTPLPQGRAGGLDGARRPQRAGAPPAHGIGDRLRVQAQRTARHRERHDDVAVELPEQPAAREDAGGGAAPGLGAREGRRRGRWRDRAAPRCEAGSSTASARSAM